MKIPLSAFVISVLAASSITAMANVTRVGVYGGSGVRGPVGGVGCGLPSFGNGGSFEYICAFPEVNPPSEYVGGNAFFGSTWNAVQDIYACVSFPFSSGSTCTHTVGSCAGDGSACQVTFNAAAWNANISMFKYLIFADITPPGFHPGTELSGYTVVYYQ